MKNKKPANDTICLFGQGVIDLLKDKGWTNFAAFVNMITLSYILCVFLLSSEVKKTMKLQRRESSQLRKSGFI